MLRSFMFHRLLVPLVWFEFGLVAHPTCIGRKAFPWTNDASTFWRDPWRDRLAGRRCSGWPARSPRSRSGRAWRTPADRGTAASATNATPDISAGKAW